MRVPSRRHLATRWGIYVRRRAGWRGRLYRLLLPRTVGRDVRLGRLLTLDNPGQVRLENGVIIADGVLVAARRRTKDREPTVRIGAKTFINNGCSIAAGNAIDIGCDVLLGPNVTVVDQDHAFDQPGVAVARSGMVDGGPVTIGDGAWIAANSVILGGTTIPPRSVVAANSVVRGTFEGRVLIAGAPARVIRQLDDA